MRCPRLVALATLLVPAAVAVAQDIRITGVTWVQSIDLRPLRRDSVLASATTGTGTIRRTADGRRVLCQEGDTWCGFLSSGERESTRPFLQDLGIAAWGLGEGISFHAQARFRDALGSTGTAWPRVNDKFDVLQAYLELDRSRVRVRAGRLWSVGGLGAYGYDGGAVTLRHGAIDGDVFGGRALVQGLNEPYTSPELGAVEEYPPETSAWMFGGRVRARPGSSGAITLSYLRVLQDDRSGLYAERASADAAFRVAGIRLAANWTQDLASNQVNEARLRASRGLPGGLEVAVEGRRHRPYFELWTIWGAFAPVGFDEGRATLGWRTGEGTFAFSASGAYRTYDEAGVGLEFAPLRTDGWRASADATWVPGEHFTATANYGVDIGFGSSQSDGTAGLQWHPSDRFDLGATASALQTIYEFRVGTGRVLGMTGNASMRLTNEARLRVDAGIYRHRYTNDAPGADWSQRRASVRLEWAVGSDPGAVR